MLDFLYRAEHDELLGLVAKGLTAHDLDMACAQVHDHYDRLRRLAPPAGEGSVA
jgi:hypothetical protein